MTRIEDILDENMSDKFHLVVQAIRDEDGKTAYQILYKILHETLNDFNKLKKQE